MGQESSRPPPPPGRQAGQSEALDGAFIYVDSKPGDAHQGVVVKLRHPPTCGPLDPLVEAHRRDLAEHALRTDGLRAFESPKQLAAAHEAGHVVHGFCRGEMPTYVRIWPAWIEGFAEPRWEGQCEGAAPPPIGIDTDPKQDLVHVRGLLAGVTAEKLFAADHYRLGSSIDEIAAAMAITEVAAMKMGCDSKELFHKISKEVEAELWAHREKVCRIADELIRKDCIDSQRLRVLLAGN